MKCRASLQRTLSAIIRLFSIVALVTGTLALPQPAIRAAELKEVESAATPGLLSYTAGGHVLGFGAEGVYVAAGDHALKVEFEGTAGMAPVSDSAPDRVGLGARAGLAGTPALDIVTYPNLWPGISLTYESMESGIAKSTYFVDPGARVEDIRLRYNVPVELAEDGSLRFLFETGEMRESAPVAWQEIEGEEVRVDAAFRLLGEREVGFALGPYDLRYGLVIDPGLAWNAFLGGSGNDRVEAVVLDGDGNIYVAGWSTASWGSAVPVYGGGADDAFAAKLDNSGDLLWHTFLGGSGSDLARDIAVDGNGNAYVAGFSSATWGSPVLTHTSGYDAFFAKLATDGSLVWNTFLGDLGEDYGYDLTVDGSGNSFVAGYSDATWGSPLRDYSAGFDVFAAKLDGDGNVAWSTFLGGSGSDLGYAIVHDSGGNLYLGGRSSSTWGESPIRPHKGAFDGFVAELNSGGTLQWNTFLGGSGSELVAGLAVDGGGNVYAGGRGNDTWEETPVRAYTSDYDAFAARLDGDGALQWHTFLGGSGYDEGIDVVRDSSGSVYVSGRSNAGWGSAVDAYTSGYDAFAAKLDGSGALQWNTFLGSSGTDWGFATTVDGSGNVYVAGYSDATWGSPVSVYSAGDDGFAAKVSIAETGADPAGACNSNNPCYTTLVSALDNVLSGGTVNVYSGTYTQSLSLSRNLTVTLAANAAITGSLSLMSGTLNTAGYTLTLSGDWTNTGGTYSANGGTVVFDKTGTATLSKTGVGSTETFCNLVISSTTTLDVSDDFLAIAEGCSLTNNGAIRREAPAQNASTGTPLTYTDHLAYATAVLTSTGATALGSTAITVTAGQTPPTCNGEEFAGTPVKRWYDVAPAATSDVAATVRLYYAPAEANGTTASSVGVYHCGTSGGWTQAGSFIARGTDGNGSYFVEVGGVADFSSFTLGEGSPTAVVVSSLGARGTTSGVELSWETGPEVGVLGFEVWRAASDGGDWRKVNGAPVPAEGGVAGAQYAFVDRSVWPGQRYQYRIEVVKEDGGSEWYGPVLASGGGWKVYLPWVVR